MKTHWSTMKLREGFGERNFLSYLNIYVKSNINSPFGERVREHVLFQNSWSLSGLLFCFNDL